MFNDALDETYIEMLMNKRPDFHLESMKRQRLYRDRYAQAMAALSTGDVFLVCSKHNGDGGGVGIFQQPLHLQSENVWRSVELPTLQRNPAVKRIISVAKDQNYAHSVDWTAGQGNLLPESTANSQQVPRCLGFLLLFLQWQRLSQRLQNNPLYNHYPHADYHSQTKV